MKTQYYRGSIFWVFLILALSACSSSSTTSDSGTGSITATGGKSPFIIQIVTLSDISGKSVIEKSGRIVASSNLTLTAQSAGEVSKILVREWQSVKAGSSLINLRDSLTNLDLRLEQAENTVEIQSAGIETTRANLEISVENARIAIERAKQAYESLTSKNAIQYATLVNTNSKTLDAYNANYATYLWDLDRSMTSMLYEGDKILGISPDFDTATDSWDPYLGVKIGDSRALAVNAWNKTYAARGLIRAKIEKWAKFDPLKPNDDLALTSSGYEALRKYADAMVYMIQNNVVWGWLPDTLQNGWVLSWNTFRGQVQSSESQFNAWKSQISTFLKTYSDAEQATKLAVESLTRVLTTEEKSLLSGNSDLNITFQNARIDLEDRVKNAKLTLEQAEVGYKNAQILREATIKQLFASKRSAEIALEQAQRDYAKLHVVAPVDGTITRVLTSVGQTVSTGTPTLEISGKVPEVLLDIDDSLAKSLTVGMPVWVIIDDTITLTGTITAVSQVSSSNLLSSLRIGIPTGIKYIWKSVTIKITPGDTGTVITSNSLPLDAVHIISEWEWEINTLTSSWDIIKKIVKIGSVGGENVEILTKLADNTRVILSDMTNYDPLKNTLTVQ